MRGGDTVQIEKTKEQLEKLGVEVDISLELEPDLSAYDLVHLTNVTRIQETYVQMQNAKKQGKKVALSTIFWPMEDFEKQAQIGARKLISNLLSIDNIERVKALARMIKSKESRGRVTKNLVTVGYTKMQRYVVENTDLFLPNSEMEIQKLFETFKIHSDAYVVVPNGIDKDNALKYLNNSDANEFSKFKDAVISVGRIEPRKNQLNLLKALHDSNYTVILVGAVSDNHKNYFAEIQKYLDSNPKVHYFPQIDNDKLYELYKICKVNTLPSWLDTPGLVNLESAAMGCNLAISSRGTTTEYFGDDAFYCEPDDLYSIRSAVDNAFSSPRNKKLREKILSKYTWENAAKQTLIGYKRLLRK
mgnify:FL=1